ncbi:hypothetical protein ASPVEDRAFT_156008 [Aspergillus versicolor CBS 583.65]|uniref:Uncharacterized protein n=1 Tax=Aspergillus versicolor CBS 583.65 TaxID=1036611 RepID=A0A1L9Q3K1_ASPVE|nr:uncharacterized protein ASPVEDRAFT_156008 [Aspergillus versicolor CBS 583.65]OJJ08344.1 hypothetical protein ASPVEDRAFT_156008 [Aspergillus versicolor CBS 583.65]
MPTKDTFLSAKASISQRLARLLPLHSAAWNVTQRAMSEMVNTSDPEQQAQLIKAWRDSTISQLSQVGIIGAIMTAAVVGSFTWDALSTIAIIPMTMIRIAWYNSLVLAVTAVTLGMQQSVFLIRVGSTSDSDAIITNMLSSPSPGGSGLRIPRWSQMFIWQAAVGLLEWSIYFWMGGYLVFIWDLTRVSREGQTVADQVVAGCCFGTFGILFFVYLLSISRLWYSVSVHDSRWVP